VAKATALTAYDLTNFPASSRGTLPEIGIVMLDQMLDQRPETINQLTECQQPAICALIRAWKILYERAPEGSSQAASRHRRIVRLQEIVDEAPDGIALPPDRTDDYFYDYDHVHRLVEVYLGNQWQRVTVEPGFDDPIYVDVTTADGTMVWVPTNDWRIRCVCDLCDLTLCPKSFTDLWDRMLKELTEGTMQTSHPIVVI
jgi:hypothetical protein